MKSLLILALLSAAFADEPCEKHDQPGPLSLIAVGSLLALVDLPLGTAIHEGSHALSAKAFGADILEFDITPGFEQTSAGEKWFWGYARWTPVLSENERIVTYLAPKLTNLVLLGGYAALLETDNLPKNKWAQLPLTVLATGQWIDFSKDIFATHKARDVTKIYNLLGAETEGERLKYRLIHGGLSVAAGIEVGRGIYKLFRDDPRTGRRHETGIHPVITPETIGVGGSF
jgi:hypothetical protein